MSLNFKTIEWKDNELYLIDQRILPEKERYLAYDHFNDVASAIKDMVVRGAPAIGITAAFGMALAALWSEAENFEDLQRDIESAYDVLFTSRPTAINLKWAIERMRQTFANSRELPLDKIKERMIEEAQNMMAEDIAVNRKIGQYGATLLHDGQTILTHCNAGALATAGHGTALGIIYSAAHQGKKLRVYVDETRPFLQGARLTAWELHKNDVPVTLITDNMAAYFMQQKQIDCVIVGADRIAANGDVANKIGTYNLAILAKEHHLPFYVAAPISSIDSETASGESIPIEERNPDEVTNFYRHELAPKGIEVRNPAFDVTPNHLVTAIITEKGILKSPYSESIAKTLEG